MFYDELLVGTSTGLYAHELDLTSVGIGSTPLRNQLTANYDQSSGEIHIQSDYSIDEIRLYDINGKLVLTALPKQSNFSLSTELKSGIYILNSTNEKGAISSHKITVTKTR